MEHTLLGAALHIPDDNRAVISARGESGAIVVEGAACHYLRVAVQRANIPALFIPQLDFIVVTTRGKPLHLRVWSCAWHKQAKQAKQLSGQCTPLMASKQGNKKESN